jgi:diaminohydroxyphosphoribosylaminopyrimidine deaminase/5-amino-6-(5-phosphoribosylamino)uracil reductase
VTSEFMSRALELAREKRGRVSPGASVGAVVVKDGRIIGEGYYKGVGSPHAEVAALESATEDASGAAIYVTLEPCCHQGKTGPCTEAVIAAGVAEVHFAHVDPDQRVSGQGQKRLEDAGIAVTAGDGEAEARQINEGYIKHRETGRPLVIAKFAATLDGKIAATSGDSRWVSGPGTRAWAHEHRTRIDAIAVGVSTVLIDNPQLTARPGDQLSEHQPLRIVIDSRGRTPKDAGVLSGLGADPSTSSGCLRTMIATTAASGEAWRKEIESVGGRVEVLPDDGAGHVSLPALLDLLGKEGVQTLLVEGGGVLHGSFFDEGLVDKVHAVIAPMIVGGDAPSAVVGRGAERMADALRLSEISVERLGEDVLVVGYTGPQER